MAEDIASYAQAWQRREAQQLKAEAAFRQRVLARLPQVLACLQRWGAVEVRLFGSFASAEATPGSDVDLLVTGLDRRHLFHAASEIDGILQEATVDLVPREIATPLALQHAMQFGIPLSAGHVETRTRTT